MHAAISTPHASVAVPRLAPARAARKSRVAARPGRELSEQDLLAMDAADYMNAQQLDFFRARLEALRDGLQEKAHSSTQDMREMDLGAPDMADRATIEEEHALELRTRDRERKLLRKIAESLHRIDSGDYGWCEETGEEIGLGRLRLHRQAGGRPRELRSRMFGEA